MWNFLASWFDVVLRPRAWGARPDEMQLRLPCDALLPDADDACVRACDVHATPAHVFRWLCQLQAAPYSYDWIDNGGRRSPPRLIPGLEVLVEGQRFMRIFTLVSFAFDQHVTLAMRPPASRLFGDITVTYAVAPQAHGTRLRARICICYPRGLLGILGRLFLPLGDAIMMRKQLLTLKALAER